MININNIVKEAVALITFGNNILPLYRENGTFHIGLLSPYNLKLINYLSFDAGLRIKAELIIYLTPRIFYEEDKSYSYYEYAEEE